MVTGLMKIAKSILAIGSIISLIASVLAFVVSILFLCGNSEVAATTAYTTHIAGHKAINFAGIFCLILSILIFIAAAISFKKSDNIYIFIIIIILSAIMLVLAALTVFSTIWLVAIISLLGGVLGVLGVNRKKRLTS